MGPTGFKRVGIDIVVPLPKASEGHTHILGIIDYATRYTEAVILHSIMAPILAHELAVIFSRVGFP